MSPIEEEIRVLLRSKVAEAPVHDEPPPVVLRRTRVIRRVNAVGAASAATAIMLGVVFAVQSLGGQRTVAPTGPVPWTTLPAQGTIEPSPGVEAKTGRACRALDVLPVVLDAPVGIGFDAHGRDVSCVIDPHAGFDFVIRGSDLKPLPVQVRVADSAPSIYVDSSRTETMALLFTWSNYCGPRPDDAVFDIGLPGSMVRIQALGRLVPPCTDPSVPSVLTFDAGGTLEPSPTPDLLRTTLNWAIDAPEQARRGNFLDFMVTIENSTEQAVSLDPCPDYVLGLRNGEDLISASYRLNCDGVPERSIPAGQRVRFEMRIYVASFLEPGDWTLFWFLVPGGDESIELTVTIPVE